MDITIIRAIETARELNEPGEAMEVNPEYVRGQAELVIDLFGLSMDKHKELVMKAIAHESTMAEFALRLISEYHEYRLPVPAELAAAALEV